MKNLHHIYVEAAKPCQLQISVEPFGFGDGYRVNDCPTVIKMSYGDHTLERRITLKEEMVDPFSDLYMEAIVEMRNNLLKGEKYV